MSDVSTLCGLCEGPCFSRSSTSFSPTNRKTENMDWHNATEPKKAENTNFQQRRQQLSLLLFAHGATQGHDLMPSGKNHSGSGIGQELICKRRKHGKNLEPTWNNTSKFLIQAQELPSSNARSNSSLLRRRLWLASGTSCWGPPANGTRLLVTTMWRPLNCPSVSTPVDTSSFPDTPGLVWASAKNKTGNEPLILQKPAM